MSALTLAFIAPAANADIIFYSTAGAIQPEQNVLLPADQVSTTILGFTNQTNTAVVFTQPTAAENLTTPANGQARITSFDSPNPSYTSLRTSLTGGNTFSLFEANPNFLNGGITFTVGVVENNNQTSTQSFTSGNGQSYFGVQAILGQRISYIDITGPANSIVDVRQIRIGGIQTSNGTPIVPEPSEWMAMGMAAASVGGLMVRARRRRSSRETVAAA
ncbi:MAG: PEP-CTERM sorting domain-containing protein [Armatimonadota bacterium]